jgi:hypothetical protein
MISQIMCAQTANFASVDANKIPIQLHASFHLVPTTKPYAANEISDLFASKASMLGNGDLVSSDA